MPKKRKTRKEKMVLDHKRQTVHESVNTATSSAIDATPQRQESQSSMTFTLPATQHKSPEKSMIAKPSLQTITLTQDEYAYLSNDLMRTALLTCAIIFAELF